MLRLYLDTNEGSSVIPCPLCGRPLLLGVERMGRWIVGYKCGFRIRPGNPAMLVCPDYDCNYVEPVAIAASPADAVPFSAWGAGSLFRTATGAHAMTLAELSAEIERVDGLIAAGGHPKLCSARRYWQERYDFSYWHIRDYAEQSYQDRKEIVCLTKTESVRGRVKEILPEGLLLERTDQGGTVLVSTGDLRSIAFGGRGFFDRKRRFDFGDRAGPGIGGYYTPRHFVVIAGQTVNYEGTSDFGICRVRTTDPEVARTLQLYGPMDGRFVGEFPAALIERAFLRVTYAWVQGFRLHHSSNTADPEKVMLQTREMEAARALKLRRCWTFAGQREALRWWGTFRRQEVERWEHIEIPLRVRLRPRRQKRRRAPRRY